MTRHHAGHESRLRRVTVGPILGGSRGLAHGRPEKNARGKETLLASVIHISPLWA